jgi:hypothetical protein
VRRCRAELAWPVRNVALEDVHLQKVRPRWSGIQRVTDDHARFGTYNPVRPTVRELWCWLDFLVD